MADAPVPGNPDDVPGSTDEHPRFPPMAARVSRLPPDEPVVADSGLPAQSDTAPMETVAVQVPEESPEPAEAAAKPAPRIVELTRDSVPKPSPTVLAAQRAAAQEAEWARKLADTPPVSFKPFQDGLATRSAIISSIGLVLFLFPLLSLVGLVMGIASQRRIKRSAGHLTGGGSARLGIVLGVAGLVIGGVVDTLFLLHS